MNEMPPVPMRRAERALSRAETLALLAEAQVATLSMVTSQGPYAVPISPVCLNGSLYFHSAMEGRKVEAFRRDPRVWVSVVGKAVPSDDLPETATLRASERFTVFYESVMAWGTLREVLEPREKVAALRALCEKFTPSQMGHFGKALSESLEKTAVYALALDAVSGKAKRTALRAPRLDRVRADDNASVPPEVG